MVILPPNAIMAPPNPELQSVKVELVIDTGLNTVS